MKIKLQNIEELIPYGKNAKKHPKKQIDQVAESIKEFGFNQPIVVDKDNVVIVGHGRLEAAKQLGIKEVPVSTANLTTEQAKSYRLADNKLNESDWDMELVIDELKELSIPMVELTGFDKDLIIEPEDRDDEVPDVPEEPVAKLGDIYQLGEHRLMCGDATKIEDVEKLMDGQKADMVFTDPPYGYAYESNYQKKHKQLLNDDKFLDFLPLATQFSQENSAHYICCGWQTVDEWMRRVKECGLKQKNLIVWKKNNWSMGDLKGAYAGQHELILFAHKGRVILEGERSRDVWEFSREAPTDHPTIKPVDLVAKAINKHTNNLILDVFGGSGSTLIACEKLNRKCYMMELDPKYIDVIIKRWEDYTGKTAKKL